MISKTADKWFITENKYIKPILTFIAQAKNIEKNICSGDEFHIGFNVDTKKAVSCTCNEYITKKLFSKAYACKHHMWLDEYLNKNYSTLDLYKSLIDRWEKPQLLTEKLCEQANMQKEFKERAQFYRDESNWGKPVPSRRFPMSSKVEINSVDQLTPDEFQLLKDCDWFDVSYEQKSGNYLRINKKQRGENESIPSKSSSEKLDVDKVLTKDDETSEKMDLHDEKSYTLEKYKQQLLDQKKLIAKLQREKYQQNLDKHSGQLPDDEEDVENIQLVERFRSGEKDQRDVSIARKHSRNYDGDLEDFENDYQDDVVIDGSSDELDQSDDDSNMDM